MSNRRAVFICIERLLPTRRNEFCASPQGTGWARRRRCARVRSKIAADRRRSAGQPISLTLQKNLHPPSTRVRRQSAVPSRRKAALRPSSPLASCSERPRSRARHNSPGSPKHFCPWGLSSLRWECDGASCTQPAGCSHRFRFWRSSSRCNCSRPLPPESRHHRSKVCTSTPIWRNRVSHRPQMALRHLRLAQLHHGSFGFEPPRGNYWSAAEREDTCQGGEPIRRGHGTRR